MIHHHLSPPSSSRKGKARFGALCLAQKLKRGHFGIGGHFPHWYELTYFLRFFLETSHFTRESVAEREKRGLTEP